MQRVTGVGGFFQKCLQQGCRIQAYRDVSTASFGRSPQHLLRTVLLAELAHFFHYTPVGNRKHLLNRCNNLLGKLHSLVKFSYHSAIRSSSKHFWEFAVSEAEKDIISMNAAVQPLGWIHEPFSALRIAKNYDRRTISIQFNSKEHQ
jgi:hypothetical protein